MSRKSGLPEKAAIELSSDEDPELGAQFAKQPRHIIDRLLAPKPSATINIDSDSDGHITPRQSAWGSGKLSQSLSTPNKDLRRSSGWSKITKSTPTNDPSKPGTRDVKARLSGALQSGKSMPDSSSTNKNAQDRQSLQINGSAPTSIERPVYKRKSNEAQPGSSDAGKTIKRRRVEDDVISQSGTGTSSRSDALDINEWGSTRETRELSRMLVPEPAIGKRKRKAKSSTFIPSQIVDLTDSPNNLEWLGRHRLSIDLTPGDEPNDLNNARGTPSSSLGSVPRSTSVAHALGQRMYNSASDPSSSRKLVPKSLDVERLDTSMDQNGESRTSFIALENDEDGPAANDRKVNKQSFKSIKESTSLNSSAKESNLMLTKYPGRESKPDGWPIVSDTSSKSTTIAAPASSFASSSSKIQESPKSLPGLGNAKIPSFGTSSTKQSQSRLQTQAANGKHSDITKADERDSTKQKNQRKTKSAKSVTESGQIPADRESAVQVSPHEYHVSDIAQSSDTEAKIQEFVAQMKTKLVGYLREKPSEPLKKHVENGYTSPALEHVLHQKPASLHLPAEISPASRRGGLIPTERISHAESPLTSVYLNSVREGPQWSLPRRNHLLDNAMFDRGDEDFGAIIQDAEAHLAHEDHLIAQQFASEATRSRNIYSALFDMDSEKHVEAISGVVTMQSADDSTAREEAGTSKHVEATKEHEAVATTEDRSTKSQPTIGVASSLWMLEDTDTQSGVEIDNSEIEATELEIDAPQQIKAQTIESPVLAKETSQDTLQDTETTPILKVTLEIHPQTTLEPVQPQSQAGATESLLPATDSVERDLSQPIATTQVQNPDASFVSPSQIAPASRTIQLRNPENMMASSDDSPEALPTSVPRTKRSRIPRALQDSSESESDSPVVAETLDLLQIQSTNTDSAEMETRLLSFSLARTKKKVPRKDCPTLLDVQEVLRRHLKDLYDDHKFLTRGWLARSRSFRSSEVRSQNLGLATANPNGMTGLKHTVSPFADMHPIHTTVNAKTATEHKSSVLTICSDNIKSPGTSKAYLRAPVITWTDKSLEVPSYTHYTSLSRNILGNNTLQLHVWPFFGDAMTDDNSVYGALERRFHTVVKDRPMKVFRVQQALTYTPYLEAFLLEIACSVTDVLRYLLEPDEVIVGEASRGLIERDKFCGEDFDRESLRWTEVLSRLPPSHPNDLRVAALACTALWGSTQFSLWHIVRQTSWARLPELETEQADQSYSSIACRICHIHDCPYHGENREHDASSEADDDDDERAVEKLDTDYTPNNNIKKRVIPPVSEVEDSEHIHTTGPVPLKTTSKPKSVDWWMEKSKTYNHGERPPFLPCHHPGLSCNQAECRCFRDNVMCEKTCGCAKDCERRYKGCSCKQGQGKRKQVCYPDGRCDCWRMNRECDPDLCGRCGAHLVLDRENRYDDGLQESNCHNVSIQVGRPKRTLLGNSRIHGFGLYAGEAIKKDEYIGEYQGEIIGMREMQRRDAIYKLQNLSYVFSLNSRQSIDSQQLGNKIRFINAASSHKNIGAKIMLCNTTHRIGMYALHDVKKGEELFFDYGQEYPDKYFTAQASAIPKSQNTKLIEDFVEPDAEDNLSTYEEEESDRSEEEQDNDEDDGEPISRASSRGRTNNTTKSRAKGKGKLVPASAALKASKKASASSARKSEDQSAFRRLGKRAQSIGGVSEAQDASLTPTSGRTSSHGGARIGAGRPPGSSRKTKTAKSVAIDGADGDEEMGEVDIRDGDGESEVDSDTSDFVDESEESSQDVPRRSGRRRTRTKIMDD